MKPVALSSLEPGEHFRTVSDPKDPWPDCRAMPVRRGVLVALTPGSAQVRFGEVVQRAVVVRDRFTGEVKRQFTASVVPPVERVSLSTPVVRD